MAKRYGRNQKRVARQRIDELEASASQLESELKRVRTALSNAQNANYTLRIRLDNAKAEAMNEFMSEKDRIEDVMKHVGEKVSEAWSKEARPVVEKLVDQMSRQTRIKRIPDFDASVEQRMTSKVIIRGHIPAFEYNFVAIDGSPW